MAAVATAAPFAEPAGTATGAGGYAAAGCQLFNCTSCGDSFAEAADFRAHSKSERHVYNTKRKLAGLKSISQEAWERKLRETRAAAAEQSKGTDHLKAGKEKKPHRKDSDPDGQPASTTDDGSQVPEEEPPSPRRSLFDRRHFQTVDLCLAYMEKKYSFFVPDREYCTDLPGFLLYLRKKIAEPPHQCICCNRPFPDTSSVKRHMLDKCHTHLSSDVYTRRGSLDKVGTDLMQEELENFFDFRSSTREVTANFTPEKKAASILRFFDSDGDGHLNFTELAALWAAAADGAELSQAQYQGACTAASAEPQEGLDATALAALYSKGIADLDAHFSLLQEKLVAMRKLKKDNALKTVNEGDEEVCEKGEKDEEAEEDGAEDDGDENDSDDDVEVVECDDEAEFEEVMRILGLEAVDFTETGDLRLPNGSIVAHRSVAHIWRQRGNRNDPGQNIALFNGRSYANGTHPGRQDGRKVGKSLQLMLDNHSAGTKYAMTKMQAKHEGKRVLAVLRRAQQAEMKQGMKNAMIANNRIMRCPTTRGDMSGAGAGGR